MFYILQKMRIDRRLLLFLRSAKEADENGHISNISSGIVVIFALICTYFMAYLFVTHTSFEKLFSTCRDCTHSISFLVWTTGILITAIISVIILMVKESVRSYISGEKLINTPCGVFISSLLMAVAFMIFLCVLGLANMYYFSEDLPKTERQNQNVENFFIGMVIGIVEILFFVVVIIIGQCCRNFYSKTRKIYNDKIAYEQGIYRCKRTE